MRYFMRAFSITTFLVVILLIAHGSAQTCSPPNCWVGNFYQYNIVAQTTQIVDVGTFTGFGTAPSINEFGDVAFVGQVSNSSGQALGDTVFFEPSGSTSPTTVAPSYLSPSRTFDNALQINDSAQIAAQDRFAGSPPHYYMRVWDGGNPGFFTLVAQSNQSFQAILTDPGIDAANDVVFSALDQNDKPILVQSSPPYSTSKQISLTSPLRPLISDAGTTIVRAGNLDTSPIVLYSNNLQTPLTIADTTQFAKLGESPGISRDGEFVAFAGDLTTSGTIGPTAWDAYPGPGIFVAVIQDGAILNRMRIAGFHYAGVDGTKEIEATKVVTKTGSILFRDEGVPYCVPNGLCLSGGELEDLPPFPNPTPVYFQTFTEPGFQASTEWENRIAVVHYHFGGNGGDTLVVSFIATPNTDDSTGLNLFTANQGLWSVRADWFVTEDQNNPYFAQVYRPTPVMQVGDALGSTGETVATLGVYDQLANNSPEQANGDHGLGYWVSTNNNGQMILRASYIQQYGGSTGRDAYTGCCYQAGTMGSLVSAGGTNLVLSNDHIFADPLSGTNNNASAGDPISEPAPSDFFCQSPHAVATFYKAPTLSMGIDAALGTLDSGEINTTGQTYNIGIPASTTITPKVGMPVAKQGRTTGLTCGTIKNIKLTSSPEYTPCSGKGFKVKFTNQIEIIPSDPNQPFVLGGDSGSLIVNASTSQPVALLFAGGTYKKTQQAGVANPIAAVVSQLGISFVGGSTHSVPGCHFTGEEIILPDKEVERADLVKEKYEAELMQDQAVVGVGIGASNNDPRKAAIVVLVESGKAHRSIPKVLDGVPIQVELHGPMKALSSCTPN